MHQSEDFLYKGLMVRLHRLLLISLVLLIEVGCASLESYQSQTTSQQKLKPQTEASTQISADLLKQELDIFKQQLLAIHPDPFARISEEAFNKHYQKIYSSLNYPLSRAEFYLQLAPLLASLQDVHSSLNLPKDQHGFFSLRNERLFPLAIVVHDNKLLVAADLTVANQVPSGAELLMVNGAPADYLLKTMRTLTARETDSGQDRRIQLDFSKQISAMGYASDTYQINYLWHGQKVKKILQGLEMPTLGQNDGAPVSYYGFSRISPTSALLWLNDFNENPDVFSDFLDDKFQQMGEERVENLIIDVRFNQGGLSQNLKSLLSRLTTQSIFWANQGIIKISKNFKDEHFEKIRQRRVNKFNWGLQWVPLEWTDQLQHSIWWSDLGETLTLQLDSVEPVDGYRPPKVWVLTNGYCYSACSLFVANINYHHLGKTMGERVGSQVHYQFGYPLRFELPYSGLIVTLPAMRLEFSAGKSASLIDPAEVIRRTLDDIQQRRDPVLSKALLEAEGALAAKLGKNSF